MPLCGHGGFCTRVRGHTGAHTRSPFPGTAEWDRVRGEGAVDAAVTLLLLDFPTPPWADLIDEDE